MFNRIKESLPNLPDEVIRTWLIPIAEAYSWPPPDYDLGKWRYVLARKSLDYWRKTFWTLEAMPLDEQEVFKISNNPMIGSSVFGIIETYVLNRQNAFSNTLNGKERFWGLVDFVGVNGKLPAPPIVRLVENTKEIVDGNHRLAALVYIRALWKKENQREALAQKGYVFPAPTHATWIATPPAEGEYVPNPLTAQQELQAQRK